MGHLFEELDLLLPRLDRELISLHKVRRIRNAIEVLQAILLDLDGLLVKHAHAQEDVLRLGEVLA